MVTGARERPMADTERPKYRILYHHRTHDLDGQRVHIREIQTALRAGGHTVIEVSPLPTSEMAGAARARNWKRDWLVRLVRLAPKGLYECVEWGYNVVGYWTLSQAIRRVRPDFIYERYAVNSVAGVWASRKHRIPLLLEVNSPLADEKHSQGRLVLHRLARYGERYVLCRASRVLAVSAVLRKILVEESGADPARTVVIHNGVRSEAFARAHQSRAATRDSLGLDGRVVIGSVAFFLNWHGIDQLLEAVAEHSSLRERVHVLLVGDGPAIPELKAFVSQRGLNRVVTFLGATRHDQVPDLVSAMDIVVLPRATEYASPLKLFEYMAAGKAIVAPRQENLMEVLTDGVDALCFAPGQPKALAAILQRLVDDDVLRGRLGRAARTTVEREGFTWTRNAARIIQVFEGVMRVLDSPVGQRESRLAAAVDP